MIKVLYNLAEQKFKASSRASVGVYNVSVQIAGRLSAEMPCTLLMNNDSDVPAALAKADIRMVNAGISGIRRMAWDQWGLNAAVDAERPDWLFLPKGFSSFMRKPPCRLAVYVHDVVYAYWRKAYPGYRSRWLHAYFDAGLKASLRNADVVFTNSDFTAGELRRFGDRISCKQLPPIVKAGIGFDHLLSAPSVTEKQGILVYLSSWPHKNSTALLDKLKRWQMESGFAEPVYFLGSLPEQIHCPQFPAWTLLGILPELEYRVLLGRVRCSVFNSEYEGFGMPPGEAVIQGAVPVYSSIPALKEVMNGIGFSYDNDDFASFAGALNAALSLQKKLPVEWKKNLLDLHNWSNVVGTIKKALE